MFLKNEKNSFYAVAMVIITVGSIVFVFGLMGWYVATIANSMVITEPFNKALYGLIIIALGYIILELDLLRNK